jgi:hypothetical protein
MFQELGDTGALLQYAKEIGGDTERYRSAVGALKPIFEALMVGLQPSLGELDCGELERLRSEVATIVIWMAESDRADMKTAGIRMMGFLHWERFMPRLKLLADSDLAWLRDESKKALAKFNVD